VAGSPSTTLPGLYEVDEMTNLLLIVMQQLGGTLAACFGVHTGMGDICIWIHCMT
jgi:hypothetical protein